MSLLTGVNESAPSQFYFQVQSGDQGALPCGLAKNLTWTQIATTGYWLSNNVPAPGVKNTSLLSCSTQIDTSVLPSDLIMYTNSWLVLAYAVADSVRFIVAAQPTDPSRFGISWAVVQL